MASGSKNIGGINVGLTLDSKKFNKGLKDASKTLTGFDRVVAKTGAGLKAFSAIIGGISVAAFARFTKSKMDAIGAMSELSTKTGISTTVLAGYTLAAEEAGVASESFEKGIITMTRKTQEAAEGVADISATYKALGIDAKQLAALAPDRQFLLISDAINGIADGNKQLTATLDIFGARQSDFVNLIRGGRDALNEAAKAASDMGLVVEDQMAKRIDAASESIDRFKKQLGSIGVKAAVGATPFIEGLNETLEGIQFAKRKGGILPRWLTGKDPKGRGGLTFEGPSGFDAPEQLDPFKKFVQKARTDSEILDFRIKQAIGGIRPGAMMDSLRGGLSTGWKNFGANIATQKSNRSGIMGALQSLMGSNDPALSGPKSITEAMNNSIKFWGGALGPMGRGVGALRGMMGGGGGGFMGQRPSLALAESGSADSYRQQAAIRRQSEGIAKQQLAVQKQMRDGINKIADAPPMRPANFKG
jgi:hypothetical protein